MKFTLGQRLAIRVGAFALRRTNDGQFIFALVRQCFRHRSSQERWELYQAMVERAFPGDRVG